MKLQDKKQLLCRYIERCIELKCDYSHVLGKPLSAIDFDAVESFIERHLLEPVLQHVGWLMAGQTFKIPGSVTRYEFAEISRPGFVSVLNKTTGQTQDLAYSTEVELGI